MMTLDHVGDREAMVYAQLGQQPLARTTETSLERSSASGTLLISLKFGLFYKLRLAAANRISPLVLQRAEDEESPKNYEQPAPSHTLKTLNTRERSH